MCKGQQNVMRHTEKQKNMTQTKEWNKSTETNTKEMEVYELPDKESTLS